MILICFFLFWQGIQTVPASLLELPLSLLNVLLLCEPNSIFHLRKAACGFFTHARDSRLNSSKHVTAVSRTANSLLIDLLQLEMLWGSAVELLTLLSLVACSAQPGSLQLNLEPSAVQYALGHTHFQIRVAACRLLGYLDPYRPPLSLSPDIFQGVADCLLDLCLAVRQMSLKAVGNWLGHLSLCARFNIVRSTLKYTDDKRTGKRNTKKTVKEMRIESTECVTVEQINDDEQCSWTETKNTAAEIIFPSIAPDTCI